MIPYRKIISIRECARCGYSENKGSLHVHHLDKNRYNNSKINLLVLCANCHYGLHQGRWDLEEIGIKIIPSKHNILKKIKTKKEKAASINNTLKAMSEGIVNSSLYEYTKVQNPKYISRGSEIRLHIDNVRIFTPIEFHKISNSIKNEKIRSILEILISTGINYEEILQIHQFQELYNEDTKTLTVLRLGEKHVINIYGCLHYVLKPFFGIYRIPSEESLNKILQAFASKNEITPNKVSILSLRKTFESWLFVSGVPKIELFKHQGYDPIELIEHYKNLNFTYDELRDIRKCIHEWGF